MWIFMLAISYILSQKCSGLDLLDLPKNSQKEKEPTNQPNVKRRSIYPVLAQLRHNELNKKNLVASRREIANAYESSMKITVDKLVGQALYDVQRVFRSIDLIRLRYKRQHSYKVGFVISMLRKEIEMMNELFHLAIKHKDNQFNLYQLRIIEFVVYTNVDISHMVRQVGELHSNITIRRLKVT